MFGGIRGAASVSVALAMLAGRSAWPGAARRRANQRGVLRDADPDAG